MPRVRVHTAQVTSKTSSAPSKAGFILSVTLMAVSLLIGIGLVLTSLIVWVTDRDRFGAAGYVILFLGVVLVGLTVWGKVRIKVGIIEIHLEQNKETIKRLLLTFTFACFSSLGILSLRDSPKLITLPESAKPAPAPKPREGSALEELEYFDDKKSELVIRGFAADGVSLTTAQREAIDQWILKMKYLGKLDISVFGYADSDERNALNLALERSKGVAAFLISRGLDRSSIHLAAGVANHVETSPDSHEDNRKVVLVARGERRETPSDFPR